MTVWEHLRELRSVVIGCLLFMGAGIAVTAYFGRPIFKLLLKPLKDITGEVSLYTFSPPEVIILYLKLSLIGGLVLSSPFLLGLIIQFVMPGLKEKERKLIIPAGFFGITLFLSGVLFTYYLVLPITLDFLLEFNKSFGLNPQWRINYYLNFVITLCSVFGIAFELPLVVTILARLGIASPEFLRQKRSYVIVGLVVTSALLTPPDVITQLLLTVPLWILYELSILLARVVYPYEH